MNAKEMVRLRVLNDMLSGMSDEDRRTILLQCSHTMSLLLAKLLK